MGNALLWGPGSLKSRFSGRFSGEGSQLCGGVMKRKKGSIYRFGVSVKEAGERMGHIKVRGVFVFHFLCVPVILVGKLIRAVSMRLYKVGDFA